MITTINVDLTEEQLIALEARVVEWNLGRGSALTLEEVLGEVLKMRFIDDVMKQYKREQDSILLQKLEIAPPELLEQVKAIELPAK